MPGNSVGVDLSCLNVGLRWLWSSKTPVGICILWYIYLLELFGEASRSRSLELVKIVMYRFMWALYVQYKWIRGRRRRLRRCVRAEIKHYWTFSTNIAFLGMHQLKRSTILQRRSCTVKCTCYQDVSCRIKAKVDGREPPTELSRPLEDFSHLEWERYCLIMCRKSDGITEARMQQEAQERLNAKFGEEGLAHQVGMYFCSDI